MARDAIRYLRANPQAAILLFICVVLGLGTMIAVIASSGSAGAPGGAYDNGSTVFGLHTLLGM